jgi:PhzF family phenazine biosynthesis protein
MCATLRLGILGIRPMATIYKLDSFTTQRFSGNPAAVVLFDEYPDDALMRSIAAENNLSETAFLVASGSDYRIRWFTPTVEVPLCGHATLASAAVVLEKLQPGRRQVAFQSVSGPLPVTRIGETYRMNFPSWPAKPTTVPRALVDALGAQPVQVLENDFNYMAVFDDDAIVRTLKPDLARIASLDRSGVAVTAPGRGGYDMVSRYFAPAKGIAEDPVTGGAHCMLAPYWAERVGKQQLRGYQASARGGEITCRIVGDRVELEGACVFYLEGKIEI